LWKFSRRPRLRQWDTTNLVQAPETLDLAAKDGAIGLLKDALNVRLGKDATGIAVRSRSGSFPTSS
jgi:hypothetical protein